MASVTELLRSVAESGEIVTLVYNAGTRPGQARTLVPVSVSDNELVAVELGSNINKTYKLDRIAVALSNGLGGTNDQAVPPAAPAPPEMPLLSTLAEYVDHFRAELKSAGWHLYEDDDSFGIATRFRNGKPKKTPCVLLRYFDRGTETLFATTAVRSKGEQIQLVVDGDTVGIGVATRKGLLQGHFLEKSDRQNL